LKDELTPIIRIVAEHRNYANPARFADGCGKRLPPTVSILN